jgi:hypothetical protein
VSLTLADYARAKRLPEEFLRALGVRDGDWQGVPALAVPYLDQDGREIAVRYRLSLRESNPWRWPPGTKAKGLVYGLDQRQKAARAGYALVCEGESDAQTAWLHGVPAFGIPGALMYDDDLAAPCLEGVDDLCVVREPGEAGERFIEAFRQSRLADRVRVVELGEHKDVSALHLAVEGDRGRFVPALQDLIADAQPLAMTPGDGRPSAATRFVPAAEFVVVEEEGASAVLGTDREAVFAGASDICLYGDGGSGKTTLTVDLVPHLASGTPWLGFPVERPVRCLLIENEGPRQKFREKIARKLATWEGEPWAQNVAVLEVPWGRFSLRNEQHCRELAEAIAAHEADLVVAGPVKRLGMVGGGTPDEVTAFSALLTYVRGLLDRPISFLLVHHENKAGEVSGAWEGETDTLLHLTLISKGWSSLEIQKARWAPEAHGRKLKLRWVVEREGFEVVEEPERDRRADLIEALADGEWRSPSALREPKKKGGVGTHPDVFLPVLEAEPETFEEASGKDLGKAGGRYFRLRGESSRGSRDGWDDSMSAGEQGGESSRRPDHKEGRGEGRLYSPGPESSRSPRDDFPNVPSADVLVAVEPDELERLAALARETLADQGEGEFPF